jgi:hypothetical protein
MNKRRRFKSKRRRAGMAMPRALFAIVRYLSLAEARAIWPEDDGTPLTAERRMVRGEFTFTDVSRC